MRDSPISVLADGTNGALVTTISDGSSRRLQVDSRSVRPTGNTLINKYLLNGANSNMMVSGSASSPVKFAYSPPPGSTATITGVVLIITASTISFGGSSKFLNGSSLQNGLQLGMTVSGVSNTLALMKCNEDFLLFAGGSGFSLGSAGKLFSAGTNSVLSYSLGFSQQLTSSDTVFFSVQDNITSANTGNNLVYCMSAVEGFVNQ